MLDGDYDAYEASVPSFEEDLDEAFTGPEYLANYGATHSEGYYDDFDAQQQELPERQEDGALSVSGSIRRDYTHTRSRLRLPAPVARYNPQFLTARHALLANARST